MSSSFHFEDTEISHRNKASKKKKEGSNMDIAPHQNEKPIEFSTEINENHITITLPLRTLSPNQFEPWQKRYKREKGQKRAVVFSMIPIKKLIVPPVKLKFTRFAPKCLDAHDNLPMSMKKIVDQTCAEIVNDFVPGRADSYDCFTFEYDQIKSKKYGVKIEIFWENNRL